MEEEKDLFGENIAAILAIGGKTPKAGTKQKTTVDEAVRQRSQRKLLRVTFPDSKVICYNRATTTFTMVLRRIGPEKVATVGLEANRYPLVLKDVPESLKDSCEPLDDGWFANLRGSDTNIKYRQLLVINEKLDLGLKIEIGSDFETTKSVQFGKSRAISDNLLVKFPDGTFVGGEKAIDTYRGTIKKIGIDLIQRKGLEFAGKQIISLSKLYNGQEQVGPHQWLTIPGTTKDKARLLKSIALMLHLNLEITII